MPPVTSSTSAPAPATPLSAQWHVGHAVTAPKRCCTAYRHRYVVYAATDNAVAVVDVTSPPSTTSSIELRWRSQMRVFSLSAADEAVAFVSGHPERDIVCVGTQQHGLYVTSLSQPIFAESTKLPRSVTGDATYGATFLFTEAAHYLAFSSLLSSHLSDPAPYRLSLWCMDTHALLWRGAMAPLESMCSFSFDLSFAACQAGKVCLFTVQTQHHSGSAEETVAGSRAGGNSNGERSRLMVLSRPCSAVTELRDAEYTHCIAGPAEGEDAYIALTASGFLVALHATSGAMTRWMDCKVPAATGLCVYAGDSLVLTGELTRFFHASSWEFQGRIKLEPPAGAGLEKNGTGEAEAKTADAFTGAVAADDSTVLLFYRSGAMSSHSVGRRAGTHRLALHRSAFFPNCLASCPRRASGNGAFVTQAGEVQWLVVSDALWCWWTPHLLLFVSAANGALVAAYAVASTCVTLHPASGTVVLYDTQRRALVAYGRTATSPVAEVSTFATAAAAGNGDEETITSLASSAVGESFYALVSLPKSGLPPRLRRYRCGWGTVKKGEVSEKSFYIECMTNPDSGGSDGGVSLPDGTQALLVHAGGHAAATTCSTAAAEATLASVTTEGDRVVSVQRNTIVAVGLSEHRERTSASTYTHPDVIQRVLPCRGGLLVLAAASCAFVQWKGGSACSWAATPLVHAAPAGRAVVAAVAAHRPDVAVVCVDRAVAVWRLSDSPRLLASCVIGAAAALMVADVEETARQVRFYAMGTAGIDAYRLDSVELRASSAPHPDVPLRSPVAPVAVEKQKAEVKPSRPVVPPLPTSRTATTAVAPLTLPARGAPAPAAPAAATARPTTTTTTVTSTKRAARTPRHLARTVASQATPPAPAPRQRRTVSVGAPSSRQLNERFDELTGFYAKQKQENRGNEHPRTPRPGGVARQPQQQPTPQVPADAPPPSASTAVTSAPPLPQKEGDIAHPTHFAAPRARDSANPRTVPNAAPVSTAASASMIDVSASTVDSQTLRSAVAAATAGASDNAQGHVGQEENAEVPAAAGGDRTRLASSVPLSWSDSPPRRADPRRDDIGATTRADDAVLRGSASAVAKSPPQPPQVQLQGTEAFKQQQQHSGEVSASNSFTSEHFTVQARHLRESLLQIKELLEQSEMAESATEMSMAQTDEPDLDELALLLTSVAAQLHQRQVRRSAESA
ncbi:hypothetical protein ABB37_07698 [Leptomonas pyrrhocoris]|uniref:Uncharacterized protein n=1 Tax=Leptomonas pyrrhocoris TaxID=157538 RepID=A0A0M9FUH9_LEPPY|nr:hypothetical protein ABB37_07698 [Leptomonas pyrrhocoris]KPA76350.1 hypothetical protein ABB37_07698 [Leptomonas pyrrhocoris]|eukprot:XP_015654789.1 hypothetical protein ABB37_07698 [Leptomonas pyrrhocoris]